MQCTAAGVPGRKPRLAAVLSVQTRPVCTTTKKKESASDGTMQNTNQQFTKWSTNGIDPWNRWSRAGGLRAGRLGFWVRGVMMLTGEQGGRVRVGDKLRTESCGTRPSRGWKMGGGQQPSRVKVSCYERREAQSVGCLAEELPTFSGWLIWYARLVLALAKINRFCCCS